MTNPTGFTSPDPARELSKRAVTAAVALARKHGVRVVEPTVLADYYSVAVHLKPAPVVARVSTLTAQLRDPIEPWLEREVAVTSFLSRQGAPVVAPSSELPPGPHRHGGLTVTFWTHLQAEPGRETTMADCAAMLADLHAALRSYADELPVLASVGRDIEQGLVHLPRTRDLLSEVKVDQLRELARDLEPLWETPRGELRPLHGDAHPGNLIVTKAGPVWLDFEDVCSGPVEWDLALLNWFDADAVAQHHHPDPERLEEYSRLRAPHVAMCQLVFYDVFKNDAEHRTNLSWAIDKCLQGD